MGGAGAAVVRSSQSTENVRSLALTALNAHLRGMTFACWRLQYPVQRDCRIGALLSACGESTSRAHPAPSACITQHHSGSLPRRSGTTCREEYAINRQKMREKIITDHSREALAPAVVLPPPQRTVQHCGGTKLCVFRGGVARVAPACVYTSSEAHAPRFLPLAAPLERWWYHTEEIVPL